MLNEIVTEYSYLCMCMGVWGWTVVIFVTK